MRADRPVILLLDDGKPLGTNPLVDGADSDSHKERSKLPFLPGNWPVHRGSV
jgi:hypothetical protein